ncbi:DUF6473 family protein [Roseisalinus antarcticus]|uniref:DUF6473 domain-containing protein n=1 Tax=Roseisalinus antarcticus TaxID=254357 RepID=A0A1Y5SPK6_9RHOB|nr:DUF6473 family protein [Roseisalinus antarcticus]SLN45434.1 hypothetical protein ROA7023_01880 [Roseisalinus antarcticus]
MKHAVIGRSGLQYELGSYGFSRLTFRRPRRTLDAPYAAFVGGAETFGKFLEDPFVDRIERRTGVTCVNFGIVNAGIGAHLGDSAVMATCHDAALTVVELMGAHNLSNRFYQVHPRRNDRFVRATPLLQEVYDEVDFADFVFTRHMLAALRSVCPKRFEIVRRELRRVWVERMTEFLSELPRKPLLLWLAPRHDDEAETDAEWMEPLFVTSGMIEKIRPLGRGLIEICPDAKSLEVGRRVLVHEPGEAKAANLMMGADAHEQVARAIGPIVASFADRGPGG